MNRIPRFLIAAVAFFCMSFFVDSAIAAPNHHNGHQMVGNQLKSEGGHVIDKVGKHTVSINVHNGKIAGMNVHHSEKGNITVKKYKSSKKMALAYGMHYASYPYTLVQNQDLGTTYIGYSFVDDNGNEQIYWFPYEEILDGDTGAVEYVALN
jgi:hypothetical protein